ncbi:YIP1 family protein [Sphingomonas alpina]|uniref:YIP1 family protein n=1 Tax=Sphingomonas alpina TaxID=653931 RepID=A0A7H0LGT1_9SPHN|nr:YIP1 family protein [Sphingomonas alpina]QNQ08884.1 YIP1 family protein [Sphingomonas alpina]
MSLLTTYLVMLFDPRRAFTAALSRKVWTLLLPLTLAIVFTALLNIFYFYHVDLAWLRDQMTATMPKAQRDIALPFYTRGRLIGISLFGVVLLALVVNLGRAFIFWIIFKVRGGDTQRFTRLFAIVMWSTAPLALILPAGILNIMLAPEGRLAGNDVNPVSLNQLLFHLPPSSGWGQLLSTFSLINIWEMVLIAIGLQVVGNLKFTRAALIAIAPDALVYGIWAAALLASGST